MEPSSASLAMVSAVLWMEPAQRRGCLSPTESLVVRGRHGSISTSMSTTQSLHSRAVRSSDIENPPQAGSHLKRFDDGNRRFARRFRKPKRRRDGTLGPLGLIHLRREPHLTDTERVTLLIRRSDGRLPRGFRLADRSPCSLQIYAARRTMPSQVVFPRFLADRRLIGSA